MKKTLICFVALLMIGLTSCSLSSIPVDVMRPADIFIPQEIKSLAIANRSLPAEGKKGRNIVEGLFSGEGIGTDKKASEDCVEGLVNMMQSSPRYTAVSASAEELRGTGTEQWPIPMSWERISNICERYGTDALVTLETFDSDSRTYIGDKIRKSKKVDGNTVYYYVYPATLDMEVTAGWRIYHPESQSIIDQSRFTDVKSFSSTASTPSSAESGLPSKRKAVRESGLYAGAQYGFRISPMWTKVTRTYYVKGHENLELAKPSVKIRDWEKAAEYYQALVEDEDHKVRSRACYNMAFINEMMGFLDVAIEWVKQANDYGLSQATIYYNTLIKRQKDEQKLKKQLSNE